jgi:hypothetical protein
MLAAIGLESAPRANEWLNPHTAIAAINQTADRAKDLFDMT